MKMKTCGILLVFLLLATAHLPASTGIGFIMGEPTGLSLKFDNFPVMGIAWSLNDYLHIHMDYWFNSRRFQRSLYWYWGFGGKVIFQKYKDKDFGLGLRVPIGIRYFPARSIEIFFELAPGMKVYPRTEVDVDAGIGIRFIL
jgi:hypothetical protein